MGAEAGPEEGEELWQEGDGWVYAVCRRRAYPRLVLVKRLQQREDRLSRDAHSTVDRAYDIRFYGFS